MNKKKWLIYPLLLVSLTACGDDLANALDEGAYRSDIFAENMYQVWPSGLAHVTDTIDHDVSSDHLITGFMNLDTVDYADYQSDIFGSDFAQAKKLSAIDASVSYGFTSKLFDGILHCFDAIRNSKSRLQIDPSGFGYVFPHEMWNDHYVGLFMKSAADTDNGGSYISNVTIHLSFYVLSDNAVDYVQHRFNFTLDALTSASVPEFYGFYFEDILGLGSSVLRGTKAVSLTYDVLDPSPSPAGTSAIFVYELLLPDSEWR